MRSTSLSPYLHSEQVGILNKNKYILNIKHDTYLKTQGLILINLAQTLLLQGGIN